MMISRNSKPLRQKSFGTLPILLFFPISIQHKVNTRTRLELDASPACARQKQFETDGKLQRWKLFGSPDDAAGAASDGAERGNVLGGDLEEVPEHIVLHVAAAVRRDALDVPLPGGTGLHSEDLLTGLLLLLFLYLRRALKGKKR